MFRNVHWLLSSEYHAFHLDRPITGKHNMTKMKKENSYETLLVVYFGSTMKI